MIDRTEIKMNWPFAAGLTAALAISAAGLSVTDARSDPLPPAATPVDAVTVKPEIPKTDGVVAKGKDTDIVCFREEETGSRLGGKRVCMTRAQYIQRARDAQNALDDIRRDRGVTSH